MFILMQEDSSNYITQENLEAKIQEALENEVNYNYALTPKEKKTA